MILYEFHVAQWHPVAIGQRHAVAGHDATVGVLQKHTSRTPSSDNHRLRSDEHEFTSRDPDCDHALTASILDDEIDTEILVEPADRRILNRRLEQRVQDVKSAFVGRKPGALDLHPAERPHVDMAVSLTAPGATPVLELHQFFGAVRDEIINDVLVAQPVPADDGVVEMMLE